MLVSFLWSINLANGQSWKMADVPLKTPWADLIGPSDPLPEYPRPMMTRPKWINLNGIWEFQELEANYAPLFQKKLKIFLNA